MSSKIIKIEVIQPKFDEIYKKFQDFFDNKKQGNNTSDFLKNFAIIKIISEEKKKITNIKVANDHRQIRDKWLNIKRILDALYNLLSPFGDTEQTISLYPHTLPINQQKYFKYLIKDLFDEKIVDSAHYWAAVRQGMVMSTTVLLKDILSGEHITVKNKIDFENYKKIISEFVDFIQEDGKTRFPEAYNRQKSEIEKVRQEPPTTKIEIISMPPLELRESKEKQALRKIGLKSVQISYDDNKPVIKIGEQNVALPPFKNEHYFCRAIFQHPTKEFIDWSIIFENMDKVLNSTNKKDSTRDKRMVQDTMYAINKRIKKIVNTDDDLFSWKEKSIRRNY